MSSRVLIADANGESAAVLADWLTAAGCTCVTTPTGEALSDARRLAPDVAVIGVRGVDDGGMWVVRALRAQHATTAVIVVASPPDFDVATAANRLGVVDCLPGPPTRGAMLDAVTRAGLWCSAVQAARESKEGYSAEMTAERTRLQETLAQVEPDVAQSVLLAVLESRSPDTHDHSQRVASLAVTVAKSMGWTSRQRSDLERAALLHDIGKIVIPARLLDDTCAVSGEDMELLKQHVTIGADILRAIPALASAASIVQATHERMDGRGYPSSLVGDAIPFEARIIAVADTYDALTAVRAYREPVSRDQANAELVRASGPHLDPAIVRAWLGLSENVRCS